jgi:acetyl-CoA carboxylase / biotin carboxylase 1
VALRARGILVESLLPSYEERLKEMEKVLLAAVAPPMPPASASGSDSDDDSDQMSFGRRGPATPTTPPGTFRSRLPDVAKLTAIVETNLTVDDVLTPFFYHADPMVVLAALEVYVRRAYRAYDLRDVHHVVGPSTSGLSLTEWRFRFPDHPAEGRPMTGAAQHARVLTRILCFAHSDRSGGGTRATSTDAAGVLRVGRALCGAV